MPAPTVAVTVDLSTMGGEAVAGVTVRARLDMNEVYEEIVISQPVEEVTDASGIAILNLFPNAPSPTGLGTQGSTYRFTASIPNGRSLNVRARVPNEACRLENILVDSEPVTLSAAELALAQAQTAVTTAATSAAAASTSATNAASSASSAQTSATNAATSATNAATSEANASASEAAALAGAASAQFADYTALRAYAGASKNAVITGYLVSTAPSGIAGIFTRDDSDTTSADNGGTIIVASNGKRWKRVIEGPINVRWFGAKGDWDGSTGTDDTAAFVALRSFCRTNGQKAYTPAGRYRLTESLALGTDAGGFPYSGFDFEGDGAECTEFVLDYDGANGLDINPGTGGYTAFANSALGGFRITVPTGRTVNVPLYVKNCYNDRFHDIHIYVPAACADASFIGMRVSGACYFNKFENIWIENHTGTANAGSRAFYIGNGLADVGDAGANTSVNTFLNCRAYGFGVNWDTIYANSTTFINCDSETGITRNWRDFSTIGSTYINCWEEGGPATSVTIDRTDIYQADGSTITGAASDQLQIKGGLWSAIEIGYGYHIRIAAAFSSLTVGANAEDVEFDNLKDAGTLTGGANDVRGLQRKTSPVVRNVTNIGSRRVGWQFGATTGPAELLMNYSGDDLQLSAYRTDGSSAFRGWKQATGATGAWVLSSWFTGAAIGSESPVEVLRANISAVSFSVPAFPISDNSKDIGDPTLRWANAYVTKLRPGAGAVIWTADAGTPEGSVTAPVGSLYTRTDGGAGTTLYVKESGSGNTGWVAK